MIPAQKNNCSDKFMELLNISKLADFAPPKTNIRVIFFKIIRNKLKYNQLQMWKRAVI